MTGTALCSTPVSELEEKRHGRARHRRTAHSAIGRAFKGSRVELRPDDLVAGIVVAALSKVPELDPSEVEPTS